MSKIPEHTIEQIKDSNDIVEVIGSYLPMKKKGANYWARCPFHNEKTASFSVSASKQIYHCFGCGVGGNVINFVMEYEKLSFIEAVKQLAERANIQLEFEQMSPQEQSDTGKLRDIHIQAIDIYHGELFKPEGKIALEYLLKRGLSEQCIKDFKLGYAPEPWEFLVKKLSAKYPADLLLQSGLFIRSDKDGHLFDRFRGRVMFPVHDDRGNAVGFGGRTMKEDKKEAKYLNSPETPIYNKRKILYGLNITKDHMRKEKRAMVVEGYMDFLQLYQHGYTNVIAGSGTAFTGDHGRLLRRFADEAILCYDSDTAGQKAAVKTGFTLSAQKLECKILQIPQGEDPDSFLQKNGVQAFHTQVTEALPFMEFLRVHYQPAKMSAKQKSDTITTLLDEIRNFTDPVYREMFAREIAKLFLVEEQTLLNQLNKQKSYQTNAMPELAGQEKPKQFKNRGEAAEYLLLQLIVNGSVLIRKAGLRYLSVTTFKHPFLKRALAEILAELQKNVEQSAEKIPENIKDTKVRSFCYQLLMEQYGDKNQKALFIDSLKQLEMQMLIDQYNILTEELKTAEQQDIIDIMKKQMKNMEARKHVNEIYNESIFKDI